MIPSRTTLWLAPLLAAVSTACAVPVAFQVDLSAQQALGLFDPAVDTVLAAGTFNGGSASDFVLEPSAANPSVYVDTVDDITDAVGATVQYKLIVSSPEGTTWEGNVGSGGGTGNRKFTLAETDQTLPVVFFNNAGDLGRISIAKGASGKMTAAWTAAPAVRLQRATTLSPPDWQDAANTAGQGTAQVDPGAARLYLRLVGP